jgi:Uma2 family endonuclease
MLAKHGSGHKDAWDWERSEGCAMTTIRPSWGEVFLVPPGTTADDLLRMPDDGCKYELYDGLLVREGGEMTSAGHGVLCQRLGLVLGSYAQTAGFANPIAQNMLFDLTPAGVPERITFAPDLSILRATTPLSWTSVPHDAPLLAVEVVSASQTLAEMAIKAQIYLRAGVEEVWVIDYKTRGVEVWTPRGTTTLGDAATLTSPLLPSFSVSVRFLLDG